MIDLKEEKQKRIDLASAQQRQASNPELSVWVEASAGTGKTKVLSDRVLRLLLERNLPGKILCLTYTKAAAVEMSSRIADKLSKWAVASDEVLCGELMKLLGIDNVSAKLMAQARRLFAVLLDTPGGMKIQTIHSFCQEILKRFPLEAKISPYFEVMDDRTAKEALFVIRKKLLQKIEEEPESKTAKALAFITAKMSEFTFPSLMNSLTENRSKIMRLLKKNGGADVLLHNVAKKLSLNFDDTSEDIENEFWRQIRLSEIKSLVGAMQKGSSADAEKAKDLGAAVKLKNYDAYRKIFVTDKGEPRKRFATQEVFKIYPEGREFVDEETSRVLDFDNRLAAIKLFESTKAVVLLAEELLDGYSKYKELHSKADYEDLIVLARNLLENPQVAEWVLYKLDGGIDNVLIDEAQDTSADQWAIVRAITNEFFYGNGTKEKNGTLFVVGDRKQSIYSFQGADPVEFEKMCKHFLGQKNAKVGFKKINLEVSFRSTAAILDVVNSVFAEDDAKQGVATEEQKVWHIPSRIGEAGKVELWPLVEAEKGENPDIWLPPVERVVAESTSSKLAKMIAARIYKMVSEREMLVSQNRPLRYRDFMILVQRRNSFVEELIRACKNVGVNIAGADKIRLLEQIAVQDLVSLGKFVLLPDDDLTLAEILKSPLFGLQDDDLLDLCYNRKNMSLWQRIKENTKYEEVSEKLQRLLNMADKVRPFEFYSYVLNRMEGRKKFVSRIGFEVEDGLDEFINLSLRFEQEHIPSMQLFIEWIAEDDVEIKREMEQSDVDAVRIMTVHGSKGLQAPVVILPDMVRVKAIRNEAGLLMDEDVLFYPFGSAEYEKNCKKIKEDEKKKSLDEYHRLLYVALTRAEERLCLCGYQRGGKVSEDSWYELCRKAISKISRKEQDNLIYDVIQTAPLPAEECCEKQKKEEMCFEWIKKEAPIEGMLAKPLMPSRLDDEDFVASSPLNEKHPEFYRRGSLIHKMLQLLPEVAKEEQRQKASEYVNRHATYLSEREQKQVIEEVVCLINDDNFAPLFGARAKSEVPIMGEVNGQIISGQIDRLAVLEDKVMIVDFKTNRPAAKSLADVPNIYIKQLRAYKSLVERIYKNKTVEMYILWTNTANIMKID